VGRAKRVSPEAPVLVVQAETCEVRLGGAGAVAGLLRGLDAEVLLAGVVGDDQEGCTARRLLNEAGIDDRTVLTDATRPTTHKQRFLATVEQRQPHQILRVDHEQTHPLAAELVESLAAALAARMPSVDAVLISDYATGVCTPELLQRVIRAAREQGVPVAVDPARIADYERYRGATLVKPNRREAERVTGKAIHSPTDALDAGRTLVQWHGFKAVVVTLDGEGMAVVGKKGTELILRDGPEGAAHNLAPSRFFTKDEKGTHRILFGTTLADLGILAACRRVVQVTWPRTSGHLGGR
jgi:D-beta-D-heptose 7-phosphate kinase/D-beta-D-heptose 1-phosphate adenosyltransferase